MPFGCISGFLKLAHEEMLAARGIVVTYETVRQWGRKFGKAFSHRIIRQRAPARATNGIWTDEVVIPIAGEPFAQLWRSLDERIRRRRSRFGFAIGLSVGRSTPSFQAIRRLDGGFAHLFSVQPRRLNVDADRAARPDSRARRTTTVR